MNEVTYRVCVRKFDKTAITEPTKIHEQRLFFSCFVLTEVKVIFCGEETIFFSSSTSWFIKIKKSVAGQ